LSRQSGKIYAVLISIPRRQILLERLTWALQKMADYELREPSQISKTRNQMKANSEPIPIGKGLRIVLSESGEPLSIGAALHEAAERVSEWIESNPQHPRIEDARRWIESVEQIDRRRAIGAQAEKIAKPALDYSDCPYKKSRSPCKSTVARLAVTMLHARELADEL
jgi:hypothetical protein